MLKGRLDKDNTDIEWQDITDFRQQYYNESEARDTTRKGGKLINEYLEAGWNIVAPAQDSLNVSGKQTITLNADKSQTSENHFYIEDETKLRDNEYLLILHNYDPRLFEIVNAKNSKWNTSTKEGTKTLFSSKVTVRPKKPEVRKVDIEEWFERLDRNYSKPTRKQISTPSDQLDKLLILPISDLHYALNASILETGNEYNCEIAEKLFFHVINDIVQRTQQYNFEKIIFTIGGDMVNCDNLAGTTTKGTPQDNCIGYFAMMEQLYGMTVKAIDILSDIAPVHVLLIPGNHAHVSEVSLANFIAAWFRQDGRVTVDTSPMPRKYVKYGKTLFAFAHDCDMKRLPQLIADEGRKFWSSVDSTEVFLQHLHSETLIDEGFNMRVWRLPTISAKSAWTVEKGYSSKRQCKSFVFDKVYGLTDILYTSVGRLI